MRAGCLLASDLVLFALSLESRTFHLKEVVLFEQNKRFLFTGTGATTSGASACNTSEVLHPLSGHCWWARVENANPGAPELLQGASDTGLFWGPNVPSVCGRDVSL